MTLLSAIFLGLLQGATEFLPISSSGHLALAQAFLGTKEAGLPFDVALHLGTLLAILIYFRDDFLLMGKSVVFFKDRSSELSRLRILVVYIVLATIPGAIAGLLLEKAAESYLRHPAIIAATLSAAGLLLLWGDKAGARDRSFQSLSIIDAILIGLSQAFAIIPGVSRSGITMTAGLFRGLDRQAVVRFSFLLSAPIIFGAGVHEIPKIIQQGLLTNQATDYVVGFCSSALSGYLFIAFLMKFVKTKSFAIFAYYRFLLSALVVISLFLGFVK